MSQSELALLQKVLSTNGYHLTKARHAVFELLLATEPQSMRELTQKAAGKLDRASVYRNVALFERLGIVHRVHIGWKYKLELSDDFLAHHHHLSCVKCGKIIDIHDDVLIEHFIADVTKRFGFMPHRHQLEVDGICVACLPPDKQ